MRKRHGAFSTVRSKRTICLADNYRDLTSVCLSYQAANIVRSSTIACRVMCDVITVFDEIPLTTISRFRRPDLHVHETSVGFVIASTDIRVLNVPAVCLVNNALILVGAVSSNRNDTPQFLFRHNIGCQGLCYSRL